MDDSGMNITDVRACGLQAIADFGPLRAVAIAGQCKVQVLCSSVWGGGGGEGGGTALQYLLQFYIQTLHDALWICGLTNM